MRNKPEVPSVKNQVSLVSVPRYSRKFPTDEEMIEQRVFPKIDTTSEVVRLADAIESLTAAGRTLKDLSSHPRDMSAVVVSAENLKKIELLLLRLPNRQKALGDEDDINRIKEEAATSVELSKQIKPLIKKILSDQMSADELYQTLTSNPNPELARKLLVGATKSQSTIIYENDVLIPSCDEVLGNITLTSKKVHHIRIKVTQLDCERHTAVVKPIQFNAVSSIFSATDIGIRSFPLRVSDSTNFFLLSQASSLDMPVDVSAVIDLTVAYKGFSYSGSLVNIKDAPQLALKLQNNMNERTKSLFD